KGLFVIVVWSGRGRRCLFCVFRGFCNSRLPPGPAPIPLLGNLLRIDVKASYKLYMDVSQILELDQCARLSQRCRITV
uniref:Uncharacterized protein n=1 Tax=Salmo trutta TaxID=8032 RepID=A0A673Y788_SALTR